MLGADWLADVIIRGILTHNLSSYFTPSIPHVITGPCCGYLSVGMALTSCSLILFLCFTLFQNVYSISIFSSLHELDLALKSLFLLFSLSCA